MNSTFQIDVGNLKVAGPAEDSVSKTIEELLELNKLIPKRTEEEDMSLTETQFDNRDYMNKPSRGEEEEITERQFEERNADEDADVAEELMENASENDGGHHGEEKVTNLKARGHEEVPPIWMEVYKKEDERKDDGSLKKELD